MKLKINKVKITSEDEYGGIYEYTTYGVLESGYKIELISSSRIDPRKFINQTIECLILANELYDLQIETEIKVDLITKKIYGKYLGEYEIPKMWNFKHIIKFDAVKSLDGHILIYKRDFNKLDERTKNYYNIKIKKPLKKGNIISFYTEKFTLLAWIPIED